MPNLENAPRSPYGDTLPDDRLLAESRDFRTVDVAKGVQIGYTLLNRHRIGEESPVVSIGAFMSDVTTPDRGWEGVQLATLDRPVLMLDLPGHGLSTPHDAKQTTDLCFRRDAASEARPLTDAVQRILNPNDRIDQFGISHGAYLSLKVAEQDPGDRVGTIFGLDLPAVKRRTTLGLQAGYIVMDGMIGKKEYLKAIEGTAFDADYESFKEAFDADGHEHAPKFVRNNPGLFAINLLVASINARDGALKAWKNIMDDKSTDIAVVTSDNGHVSDPDAIDSFITRLPPEQQKRSSQRVIPGEDHNIGIVHLIPRAVAWAEEAYSAK
jgi:pimeloyl-ACP methyl ester carboxylesterase